MAESPIRLDNDMVLERQHVEVGGYTVTLDPMAYTVGLEILLSEWGARSNAILQEARQAEDAGDLDGAEAKIQAEREYVAGLVERILQAKALPVDLADPTRTLHAVEEVYGKCVAQDSMAPLVSWIEQTKSRLDVSPNPGWDKETILERIPSVRRMYKLIVFFVRLGSGLMGPEELASMSKRPENGTLPPLMPVTEEPSVRKNSQRKPLAGVAS